MKKYWIILLITILAVAAASCGSKSTSPADSGSDKQAAAEEISADAEDSEAEVASSEAYPKTMYVTAEDGLLLREGPGQENAVITLLGYGKKIQAQRMENGWVYTSVDGQTGWCSADYLTENGDKIKQTEDIQTASTDPGRLVEPENVSDNGYHGYVDTPDGLNMRYGPGTEYDVIMALPDKTEVIERGWDGEWVYVEYNGKFGWMNSQYFRTEGGRAKPVIYLYPTHIMDVSVRVSLENGHFTRSIPAGDGEWNVTAGPDGKLTDKASGKSYDYIYWESTDESDYDWSEGYVVAGYESEEFLGRVLPQMGLNTKEAAEFTEYWLPRLEKNRFNLITFQTKCYTDDVKMDISPEPDSVLRLYMAFKEASGDEKIDRPAIIPFERKGFTAVEWGGTEVRN